MKKPRLRALAQITRRELAEMQGLPIQEEPPRPKSMLSEPSSRNLLQIIAENSWSLQLKEATAVARPKRSGGCHVCEWVCAKSAGLETEGKICLYPGCGARENL